MRGVEKKSWPEAMVRGAVEPSVASTTSSLITSPPSARVALADAKQHSAVGGDASIGKALARAHLWLRCDRLGRAGVILSVQALIREI